MKAPYRLTLTEEAFRALVAGSSVLATIHGVPIEVVLAEIPWNRQISAILDALAGQAARWPPPLDPRPLDPPEAREFLPRKNPRR
jgi:hypothetical protein